MSKQVLRCLHCQNQYSVHKSEDQLTQRYRKWKFIFIQLITTQILSLPGWPWIWPLKALLYTAQREEDFTMWISFPLPSCHSVTYEVWLPTTIFSYWDGCSFLLILSNAFLILFHFWFPNLSLLILSKCVNFKQSFQHISKGCVLV